MTDPVLETLLRAIIAEPDSDLPRLAFADRCVELGWDRRAEFIQVQLKMARPDVVGGHQALLRRCQELFDGFGLADERARAFGVPGLCYVDDGPADQLPPPEWLARVRPRRGFVEVAVTSSDAWLSHGPALVRAAPLTRVRLSDKEPTGYPAVSELKTYWRWFDGSRADGPDSCDPDELPSALWPFYAAEVARRRQTWDHLDRADAEACLSAAALAWARSVAPAGATA